MNDALMLESAVYILLKKYFSLEDSYTDLLELFHDITFQTKLGRCCDMVTAAEDTVDLENFSHKSYSFIASHKSAYYSLYLPVALALHFCHKATTGNLRMAKEIAIPMGEYLHIRNDYLGNFANPTPLRKVETGIQNNKCSWLIYEALRAANPRQRKVL
ncbi:Farnesyl pyrophosphate synthase [Lasiodiplodia theobromae]|uniref:Farnesyl pyrophosphate synthase n=1 Tax=Lasiodiplodia theobromae TaxID=45133 RepID=A0A5N5CUC2_9PEZI|nr:Farnesyl pyrophosphate synthase [Lasiodiplodia theobromae]